jgi:hypothetical protein
VKPLLLGVVALGAVVACGSSGEATDATAVREYSAERVAHIVEQYYSGKKTMPCDRDAEPGAWVLSKQSQGIALFITAEHHDDGTCEHRVLEWRWR